MLSAGPFDLKKSLAPSLQQRHVVYKAFHGAPGERQATQVLHFNGVCYHQCCIVSHGFNRIQQVSRAVDLMRDHSPSCRRTLARQQGTAFEAQQTSCQVARRQMSEDLMEDRMPSCTGKLRLNHHQPSSTIITVTIMSHH